MYKALYRKYRSQTFGDVVGQNHITMPLVWQCANNKTSHAYLFCGSRGTGKTSCARLLAKAVNCKHPINGEPCNECESCKAIDAGNSMLVYEMDAASNTGVDYVRGIKEEINFSPATDGVKVYIIDEVHMLTESAFNALLKTLEEPPARVMFILATTETRKVPATILSRCQRFDFRRLSVDNIVSRLKYISEKESIELDDDAAVLIARISEGGMRDAISLLELCVGDGKKITVETVKDTAGVFGRELASRIVKAITEKDPTEILSIISEVFASSKDISVLVSDVISYYRDMTVQRVLNINTLNSKTIVYFDLTVNEFEEVKKYSSLFTYEKLLYHYKLLSTMYTELSRIDSKRVTVEMTLMRMASDKNDMSLEALAGRVTELERTLARVRIPEMKQDTKKTVADTAESYEHEKKKDVIVTQKEKTQNGENGITQITKSFWNRITESYSSLDPMNAVYIKTAKAYGQGSKLVIEVAQKFILTMLKSFKADEIILNILKNQDGKFNDVEIRVSETNTEQTPALIDDLF